MYGYGYGYNAFANTLEQGSFLALSLLLQLLLLQFFFIENLLLRPMFINYQV